MIHDVPRTASIVVREDVELLVIDKDTCLRIFPEIMKRDYELRLEKMRYVITRRSLVFLIIIKSPLVCTKHIRYSFMTCERVQFCAQ